MQTNIRHLKHLINRVNVALGAFHQPHSMSLDNEPIYHVGCVYLSHANGGYRCEQITEGGGARNFISGERMTKTVLAHMLTAWLDGFDAAQSN